MNEPNPASSEIETLTEPFECCGSVECDIHTLTHTNTETPEHTHKHTHTYKDMLPMHVIQ